MLYCLQDVLLFVPPLAFTSSVNKKPRAGSKSGLSGMLVTSAYTPRRELEIGDRSERL